jgi:hypothetical protein
VADRKVRWGIIGTAENAASKAATQKSKKGHPLKADVALSHIRKLYAVEKAARDLSDAERYRIRQEKSLSLLATFKAWLKANVSKVLKGSLTRKAMDYTLNQWEYLMGYCERGDLKISNAGAENAIRPFVLGRRAWLFADTPEGANASATCYSLIETALCRVRHRAVYAERRTIPREPSRDCCQRDAARRSVECMVATTRHSLCPKVN